MLKRILRRLAERNYCTARALYLRRLNQEHLKYTKPPVLVFTMGKVGSSTIHSSLRAAKAELDMPIYNTHFLADKRGFTREKENKEYFRTALHHRTLRSWQTQFCRSLLDTDRRKGKRWKVVTLVREPVSRSVSEFFENLVLDQNASGEVMRIRSRFQGYEIPPQGNFEMEIRSDEVCKLFPAFFDWYQCHMKEHERFFQEELEPMLGIDVLSENFPKTKGYHVYRGDFVDLLVIRLESLRDCAREAFHTFLGLSDFVFTDANVGAKKKYAELYQEFTRSITLPKRFPDEIYASAYVKHFYTVDEIAKFKKKWSG